MKYWTTYLLIRAESNEWGIVMEQMLTAVVDRGQKLHCGPWTEEVSHATPSH